MKGFFGNFLENLLKKGSKIKLKVNNDDNNKLREL